MALFRNATAKGAISVPGDLILAIVVACLVAVVLIALL